MPEEEAAKAPLKMMIPLFFIFPNKGIVTSAPEPNACCSLSDTTLKIIMNYKTIKIMNADNNQIIGDKIKVADSLLKDSGFDAQPRVK